MKMISLYMKRYLIKIMKILCNISGEKVNINKHCRDCIFQGGDKCGKTSTTKKSRRSAILTRSTRISRE
jgi:hypothetical protein